MLWQSLKTLLTSNICRSDQYFHPYLPIFTKMYLPPVCIFSSVVSRSHWYPEALKSPSNPFPLFKCYPSFRTRMCLLTAFPTLIFFYLVNSERSYHLLCRVDTTVCKTYLGLDPSSILNNHVILDNLHKCIHYQHIVKSQELEWLLYKV